MCLYPLLAAGLLLLSIRAVSRILPNNSVVPGRSVFPYAFSTRFGVLFHCRKTYLIAFMILNMLLILSNRVFTSIDTFHPFSAQQHIVSHVLQINHSDQQRYQAIVSHLRNESTVERLCQYHNGIGISILSSGFGISSALRQNNLISHSFLHLRIGTQNPT